MELVIEWNGERIGDGFSDCSPRIAERSQFLTLFAVRRGNEGLVFGFPCAIRQGAVAIESARLLATQKPWDEIISATERDADGWGHIRADFDGPRMMGYIRADFDGPRMMGYIRADFDGPRMMGHLRADFDGPRMMGHIRADFGGPSADWDYALRALSDFLGEDRKAEICLLLVFSERIPDEEISSVEQKAAALWRELLPDTTVDSRALRAIRQHPKYFERLLFEAPRETLHALRANLTAFMLARAPLEEEIPEKEAVRLGVCAPASAPVGSCFILNFVAYAPALEEIIREQLKERDPEGVPHVDAQRVTWQEGTEVQVVVYGEHLTVEPSNDKFFWNGEKEQLDFDITIGDTASIGQITLKTDVYVEKIRIARIWLPFKITAAGTGVGTHELSEPHPSPESAFVSYSSSDRSRVIDRVASLIIRTGMDVFMDCIKLRPNQRWRDVLPELIQHSDIFLLFWSPEASKSEWVEWEWKHCLEKKGLGSIEVHPLKPYSMAPLPVELQELHAGDPLMAIREWEFSQVQAKPDTSTG